jgi:hypothetical protein
VWRRLIIMATAATLVSIPLASPAYADPEDDSHKIEKALEEAIEDYVEAEDALDKAEDNQKDLKKDIKAGQKKIDDLTGEVQDFAEAAYLNGGLPNATAVLSTGSPDTAMDGLAVVGYLGREGGEQIQELVDAQDDLEADEEALADEVDDAEKALKKKEEAKDAAQRDVDEAAGGPTTGNGSAEPAPRNPDGSWPAEDCSVTDPTGTGGCITPRMNHFYEQANAAGYDHHTSCYRSAEDGGEHPRGRACDFAASPGGFGGAAGGADKEYGDSLAGWAVDNADALGVMYVIWYNQFWDPANGWGPYSGGGSGDPSTDHTNHVHISML